MQVSKCYLGFNKDVVSYTLQLTPTQGKALLTVNTYTFYPRS